MQLNPRQHIKIAFRLWVPILVLRIVAAVIPDRMGGQIQGNIHPHAIIILRNTSGMELLLAYEDEGVYLDIYGHFSKENILQWGEMPTSVAYLQSNQVMGWGEKAIELRAVETGCLEGVFMHKKAQKLKFLCERNDKDKNGVFCF